MIHDIIQQILQFVWIGIQKGLCICNWLIDLLKSILISTFPSSLPPLIFKKFYLSMQIGCLSCRVSYSLDFLIELPYVV